MKTRFLLGAGVALAVALSGVQARAQWLWGPGAFYFGGEGGWTSLPDQNFSFSGGTIPAVSGTEKYSDGFNVGARAGYEWGPWRFEEEFRYQTNGIDGLSGFAPSLGTFGGSTNAYAVMTNVIYDFTFGWPLTPHIGAGVGAVNIHEGLHNSVYGSIVNDDSWQFGYQAIAGVRYSITPYLDLDVDYRYLAATSATFTVASPGAAKAFGSSFKSDYSSHNIVASLSVKFGAPPPPPPVVAPPAAKAPPPPPPPRVYLVFFDWDRYNITAAGKEIVRQAALAWKAGAPVKIKVNGYTDLSGPAGYNVRLSIRRANAVANTLARFGVPRSDMIVRGLGESNPRVPTAKGVREPQNRRVEIIFR